MVDTQRSLSELQTILADNTTGDISPQDLRDFLISMKNPCGGLYVTTPAGTVIGTPGTYELVAGTTAQSDESSLYLVTASSAGRLTYTGTKDMHFHVVCTLSLTCTQNNRTLSVRILKNGTTPLVHSTANLRIGTGSDIRFMAVHADTMLMQNEYLEAQVTDETGTSTITAEHFYMFIMGMFR